MVTQSDHFPLLTSRTPWNLYLQAAVVSFWQQTAAWLTSTDYKTVHKQSVIDYIQLVKLAASAVSAVAAEELASADCSMAYINKTAHSRQCHH